MAEGASQTATLFTRKSVLYYGSDSPPPRRILLEAGELSAAFEPENAFLRSIRFEGAEVLSGINAPVRDRNWGTVPPRIAGLRVESTPDSFAVDFEVECRQSEIDYHWTGRIEGDASGRLTFTFDGEARSAFLRNRIGFCVLHPMECAGAPCRITHTDGSVESSKFPELISPHQPFMDIRSIAHRVRPRLWAEVHFEGDVFEMEDQRNWTDASFKTYCTPLSIPFPVAVSPGDRVQQKVTLELRRGDGEDEDEAGGEAAASPAGTSGAPSAAGPSLDGAAPLGRAGAPGPAAVTLTVGEPAGTLPEIGLGWASHDEALSERELALLRALGLSHLRVDVRLGDPAHTAVLARALAGAKALGAGLDAALFVDESTEEALAAFVRLAKAERAHIRRCIVFHPREKATPRHAIEAVRKALSGAGVDLPVGGGTDAYFTELNRSRPEVDLLDFVAYSLNPQVHAFDNASLVETLPVQAVTVRCARAFCGGLPLSVGPVTFKPRFIPTATGPEREREPGELPSQVDPRQLSLFGAGWTLGSLKYLAESGAESLTYFETTGWRGVLERAGGSPEPEAFPSVPGGAFPLYHVFAAVAPFRGGSVVSAESSDARRAEVMAVHKDGATRILAANLGPEPLVVRVTGSRLGPRVRVKTLDERTAAVATTDPDRFRTVPGTLRETEDGELTLGLLPYAVAFIDTDRSH